MNKWTVAGVLEEVKTDVLFESDSWPQLILMRMTNEK